LFEDAAENTSLISRGIVEEGENTKLNRRVKPRSVTDAREQAL